MIPYTDTVIAPLPDAKAGFRAGVKMTGRILDTEILDS
jgi:hypothetical protein